MSFKFIRCKVDLVYLHRFNTAVINIPVYIHRVSKKTSTHIIGYKLRNSCPILIIFEIKIPHIM